MIPTDIWGKDRLERYIMVLEGILEHRRANPTLKSEELFYHLLIKVWRRVLRAKEEGKYLAAFGALFPIELFHAMGNIVGLHMEGISDGTTTLLKDSAVFLSEAAAFGTPPEICSTHRSILGMLLKKEVPKPDFAIWTSHVCDNTFKSVYPVPDLYGVPGFMMERPMGPYTDTAARFFARELERGVKFLEEQTGQKLDRERLEEVVALSEQMNSLMREIQELRKAIPAPARSRNYLLNMVIEWHWAGTHTGIKYFEQVRDELKGRIQRREGAVHQERYRLLTLFLPPMYEWKIMDWMEREYGAVSVMEPCFIWGEGEMDPKEPFLSLACKSYYRPLARQMNGAGETFVADVVRAAREYQADGALYFAHIGCRQACAMIRSVKDALGEIGVPMTVLDNDIMDPTFVSGEELRERMERFFELLEERKKG